MFSVIAKAAGRCVITHTAKSIGFAFATLNLANGENIKTVSVVVGHASSAYTLDLYAGYVPNTELGIGTRYINYLRRAA